MNTNITSEKSLGAAILLNFFLPGAGYVYMGRWVLGIVAFLFVVYAALTFPIAVVGYWLFMTIDMLLLSKNRQRQTVLASTKKCPYCAELIQNEAAVCRFCGHNVGDAPLTSAAASGGDVSTNSNGNGGSSTAPALGSSPGSANYLPIIASILIACGIAAVGWYLANDRDMSKLVSSSPSEAETQVWNYYHTRWLQCGDVLISLNRNGTPVELSGATVVPGKTIQNDSDELNGIQFHQYFSLGYKAVRQYSNSQWTNWIAPSEGASLGSWGADELMELEKVRGKWVAAPLGEIHTGLSDAGDFTLPSFTCSKFAEIDPTLSTVAAATPSNHQVHNTGGADEAAKQDAQQQRDDLVKKCNEQVKLFAFETSASSECGYKVVGLSDDATVSSVLPDVCKNAISDEDFQNLFTTTLNGAVTQIKAQGHDGWCAAAFKTGHFVQAPSQATEATNSPSASSNAPNSADIQTSNRQDIPAQQGPIAGAPVPANTEANEANDGTATIEQRSVPDDTNSRTRADNSASSQGELPSRDSADTSSTRAAEADTDQPASNVWKFETGTYSVTMSSDDGTVINMWKSCEAHSPELGSGKWGWGNGTLTVELDRGKVTYPLAKPPYDGTSCSTQ